MSNKWKKLTREQLAEALAEAMNLMNDLDRDEWSNEQIGRWHQLGLLMPPSADYWNNGTVYAKEL